MTCAVAPASPCSLPRPSACCPTTTTSSTSTTLPPGCSGPSTLTQTSIVDLHDPSCGIGTTVEVYALTATTATTLIYSRISYDSNAWNVSGSCPYPQLWCDDCHFSTPGNTAADWVWDCTLVSWTTGGWCSLSDGAGGCAAANQITGVADTSWTNANNPWGATFTLTVT